MLRSRQIGSPQKIVETKRHISGITRRKLLKHLKFALPVYLLICFLGHCSLNHVKVIKDHEHRAPKSNIWQKSKVNVRFQTDITKNTSATLPKKKFLIKNDGDYNLFLLGQFQKSELVQNHYHSSYILHFDSKAIAPEMDYSKGLWVLTLGIYPAMEELQRETTFVIFDSAEKKPIKKYRYTHTATNYTSWFSIPAAFLFIGSSAHSYSGNMEVEEIPYSKVWQDFEKDFRADLENAEFLAKLESIPARNPRALVLPLVVPDELKSLGNNMNLMELNYRNTLSQLNFEILNTEKTIQILKSIRDSGENFESGLKGQLENAQLDYIIGINISRFSSEADSSKYTLILDYQIMHAKTGLFTKHGPAVFTSKDVNELFKNSGTDMAYKILGSVYSTQNQKK